MPSNNEIALNTAFDVGQFKRDVRTMTEEFEQMKGRINELAELIPRMTRHNARSHQGSSSSEGTRREKGRSSATKREFDPLPVSPLTMLPELVERGLVIPVPAKSADPWYKPEARCHYHKRVAGHWTDNCSSLRHKIQDLQDRRILQFHYRKEFYNLRKVNLGICHQSVLRKSLISPPNTSNRYSGNDTVRHHQSYTKCTHVQTTYYFLLRTEGSSKTGHAS